MRLDVNGRDFIGRLPDMSVSDMRYYCGKRALSIGVADVEYYLGRRVGYPTLNREELTVLLTKYIQDNYGARTEPGLGATNVR